MDLELAGVIGKIVAEGGAAALALVVWLELREHRKELAATKTVIAEIGATLAKILERDRDREIKDFIREEISGVHEQAHDSDVTPIEIPVVPRRKTPPIGIAKIKIPRPGSEGK